MKLRDYQEDIATRGCAILRQHKILYLSMEVRCGKTLTALAAAEKYGAKKVLFVTKKKAISSIEQDDEQYDTALDLLTTNYEQLHNIIGEFDLIIIDEAHSIGQFPKPAERTKLLKQICAGKPIIYLSGTPTPESYSQLFHQFWVSSFSPFKNYSSFYKWAGDYVKIKKRYYFNREINDYSSADKNKIDELTKHLFISFTQQQAGFKQEVEEQILTVKMEEGTYLLADVLRKKRVYIGKGGEEILGDTAAKLLQKFWQIYSGTVIPERNDGIVFDHSKAKFIKEYFAGKKIAIFYVFKAEYAMLVWVFGFNKLTDDPDEFNRSEDKIFVSQIQAGSMGINLSTADALVMLNIHYSNVLYWQARARLQSQDRLKAAIVYWIFAENGIEEKIYKAVSDKRDYVTSYFIKDYGIKKYVV